MPWLAYFMGPVIFYALVTWKPILFKEAGLPARTATLIAAPFPPGGVGAWRNWRGTSWRSARCAWSWRRRPSWRWRRRS
jgi:hypothetical protein